MRILTALVVIWLFIGLLAAVQRDYFKSDTVTCASAGTIAVTIVAGPLNYIGANPKVNCPDVKAPQPSK
jgi:hypothetical protein